MQEHACLGGAPAALEFGEADFHVREDLLYGRNIG
jgi:hypothetical protein